RTTLVSPVVSPEAMPSAFASPCNRIVGLRRPYSAGPNPSGNWLSRRCWARQLVLPLLTRRRPRRPPPVHPEAPVDLETSLRTGRQDIGTHSYARKEAAANIFLRRFLLRRACNRRRGRAGDGTGVENKGRNRALRLSSRASEARPGIHSATG